MHDFNALCGPIRTALLNKALRLTCGDRSAAEDFVQETYVTAWSQWATFEPERGSASAWLHRIMLNRFRDNYRRLSRERAFFEDADRDEIISGSMATEPYAPADAMPGRDVFERCDDAQRAALAEMPEIWRDVMRLTAEGMDDGEIAAELGLDRRNVRKRVHRARKYMKQALSGERPDLPAEAEAA